MIQPGVSKLEADSYEMTTDESKIFTIHISYTNNIDVFIDKHFF